jgi:hypothetical protein
MNDEPRVSDSPLWERQPWDSAASFAAFQTWLLQTDRPRSLDAAYRAVVLQESYIGPTQTRASKGWRRWYQARQRSGEPIPNAKTWEERAQAWDSYQAEIARKQWEDRQQEIREADWQTGADLRRLAAQIFAQAPQFLKTSRKLIRGKPGEPDREVITLMLDVATAIRAIETGSKLQRLAAGMPDSHTEITNPGQMVTTSDLAAIRAEMEQWEREQYGSS